MSHYNPAVVVSQHDQQNQVVSNQQDQHLDFDSLNQMFEQMDGLIDELVVELNRMVDFDHGSNK